MINDPTGWDPAEMRRAFPPGKIVRLTGPGYLIDARFLADVLTGFTTTAHGLVNVGVLPEAQIGTTPKPAKGQRQSGNNRYRELPKESESIEAGIPIGKISLGGSGDSLSGEFLRGIVQIARGTFAPGLHLSIAPEVPDAGAISVRLQEGRQYLDTDPDVLFARYGVGAQEWTVVGTVGHHPLEDPDMESAQLVTGGGVINRAEFDRYINQLATLLGNLGFTDLPQSPGFSLVPWAVYRVIGNGDYGNPR
ncbi:hypothetical protein GCM10009832_11310 [Dietzia kunjamensis subsp. schimae]|uniref:hypothetical protein n=1 Tax=Dietzia kunjamensis TaxID=322509 RepID=UPI0012B7C14E|nr:hypothetical protein [Dietzia kunjamensis]MBB1013960.1 hypothetical protein [Dietzia kunjamensis subsp. schimae]